ncbi:hypothetical protein DPMN_113679 [Dreissena polymorpha]|uniref:Uncharacterized protein n=1 Tax=Dreissena polymorpha TaxID=45954 RepID=A0A9D4KHU5_DREPO|nr:hypothetical protein DPMN_113679 [Dreissena polymorpha]
MLTYAVSSDCPGDRRRMWIASIQPKTEGNPRTRKNSFVTRLGLRHWMEFS